MKLIRAVKCPTKFATAKKRGELEHILREYGKVVNSFIDHFWCMNPEMLRDKGFLLKPVVDLTKDETWFSARLRKVAAREAADMVLTVRERWKNNPKKQTKPRHAGRSMRCSSTVTVLGEGTKHFDHFLKLRSIGNKVAIDLPIKRHKRFNHWAAFGRRLNAYVITKDAVQFAFEIVTAPKKESGAVIGVDTGVKCLATTSDGQRIGEEVETIIQAINRCEHGSERQKRLRRRLRHYIDFTARELLRKNPYVQRVGVERLRDMNLNTKRNRKLGPSLRKTIGSWNYRYWLGRVERVCEENCVRFQTVSPAFISQRCSRCGHTDAANRPQQDLFRCVQCQFTDHADCNAAKNILGRGVSLVYRRGV